MLPTEYISVNFQIYLIIDEITSCFNSGKQNVGTQYEVTDSRLHHIHHRSLITPDFYPQSNSA